MAPLSIRIAHAMLEVKVEPRLVAPKIGETFAPSEGYTLQCLALSFSTISVASAILAFYWFIKMRRTFRHDLIMLLIQSDMFKALWFMVYPAVHLTHGPVASNSTFCQVSGFFLSVGIEASDTAILMIAVHSALYIFKPKTSSREGGLYPYRHFAYMLWVFFPIIMASLAFVNGSNAYVDQVTYCYLPVRPLWYRLALSWIPRYIIFLAIMGIYASIYFHVRSQFHGFDQESKNRRTSIHGNKAFKRQTLPPTPTLACHGLISEPSRQTSVATDAERRKPSVSTLGSDHGEPLARTGTTRFIWASVLANNASSSGSPPSDDLSSVDSDSFTGPLTPQPLPARMGSSPSSPDKIESVNPAHFRVTSWRDDFVSPITLSPSDSPQSPMSKRSTADIFSVLHRGPPDMSTESQTAASQLQLVNSRGQDLAVSEMIRSREKIRRQLRLAFIYPLAYMGMWVVPFASHVLQYDDRMALKPPFGLTCVTTVFICSQAAVDCWLFSTREKPWKHIHGSDGTFGRSLKFWEGWHGVGRKRRTLGPGKTRDEMVRDSRAAYQRREEEFALRRLEAVRNEKERGEMRGRSWWEATGLDGAQTPQEETADSHDDEDGSAEFSDDQMDFTRPPSCEVSAENDRFEKKTATEPVLELSERKEPHA